MLYLVIFIFLAVLVTILLTMNIKVIFEYVRDDIDDNITISFYALGIFKYKYEVPLIDFGKKGLRFRLVRKYGKRNKKTKINKEKLTLSQLYDKCINAINYYKTNNELICDLKNYLEDKLIFNEFNLYIREGTGNAYYTGIFCGLFWSLAGIMTSFLSSIFKTLKKCVAIEPDFNQQALIINLYCIFNIKFVHIIVLVMKIYINRFKQKRKIINGIGGGLSG
jgi:hypothetical protein